MANVSADFGLRKEHFATGGLRLLVRSKARIDHHVVVSRETEGRHGNLVPFTSERARLVVLFFSLEPIHRHINCIVESVQPVPVRFQGVSDTLTLLFGAVLAQLGQLSDYTVDQ